MTSPTDTTHFDWRGKAVSLSGLRGDHIAKKIAQTGGFYEIDLLEYIRFVCAPLSNICAIDVGANIGNHSVYFGLFVSQRLLSVEPNPKARPFLEKNLSENLSEFRIETSGLGEKDGVATFRPSTGGNLGGARLDLQGSNDGLAEEAIRIRSLDSVVDDLALPSDQRVGMIKVDVEGMEEDVLRGATRTLADHKPELFLEAATLGHLRRVRAILHPLGYRVLGRWAATPVYHFSHRPSRALRVRCLRYALVHKPKHLVLKLFKQR